MIREEGHDAPDDRAPDPERLKEFAKHVFGALSGAMTSAMICLGDRLGLYRALANEGPATSDELARRTGLSERWLREWLFQQGAAGVLEHRGDGRFALTPEGRAVLADERTSGLRLRDVLVAARHDRDRRADARGVRERRRTRLRRARPRRGRGRGARLCALVSRAARADGAAAHRGRGARARARRARGRRRLRRGRRAARDGARVSRIALPRLRTSHTTRSRAPRQTGAPRASTTSSSTTRGASRCPATRASTSSPRSTACTT